jgi:hypothetical protein
MPTAVRNFTSKKEAKKVFFKYVCFYNQTSNYASGNFNEGRIYLIRNKKTWTVEIKSDYLLEQQLLDMINVNID